MKKEIICIKIGGKPAGDKNLIKMLIDEMKDLSPLYHFIFVHGGGAEVTEAAKKFGIEAQFVDGKRVTGADEMKIVDAVLSGKINKQLVRQFNRGGLAAVGLSGSDGAIFVGQPVSKESRTGTITQMDTALLQILIEKNYLPVISSTSMSEKECLALNINADDAALAIASHMRVEKLIFISDTLGVLKEEKVIPSLNEKSIREEIDANVISGGMIPKVQAALNAVKSGAKSVVIGTYQDKGDLKNLIAGTKGTLIV